jgi:hypothetical protein
LVILTAGILFIARAHLLGKCYTGGAVASLVAAKIIEKTLNYLSVPRYARAE